MFERIDHVQLAIPPGTEPAAIAFWCGLLGFTQLDKPPRLAARGGAWFTSGEVQLHVGIEDSFVPALKAHPGFVVGDIDQVAERLTGAGHPVAWSDEVPGSRRFHSSDPFGNRFEVIAAPPSPPTVN